MRVRRTATAAAVTSLATIATGFAALTTTAHADTRTPTSLSIREARQVIAIGDHNRIAGQLSARGEGAVAGATVRLLKKHVGAEDWKAVRSKPTNNNGAVAFRVSPRHSVRFELAFGGDATHFPATSGVVTTTVVRRLPTAIGIQVSPHSVTPGGSADIRGRLHLARRTHHPRPLPDQPLTLEQKNADGTWQTLTTQQSDENGVVHFTVTPAQTSRYAIFYVGSDRFAPSRSNGVTIRVGQPTSLSITTSARSINPGDSVNVQGVLTENGQPLGGQTVDLLARPAHSHKKLTSVATGTTATDGTVSFTQSPTVDTIYRLLFRGSNTEARTTSPAATVLVRRPTSLSIRAEGDTVRGVLLGPRHNALGHRAVTLQSSPAGAGTWTDVATKQTKRHGGVAFTVAPTAPTDYRLVFAATNRYESCQSGVVTVGSS